MADRISKQITTPIFRLSYPHLDKKVDQMDATKPQRYEFTMIFNRETEALDKKYNSKTTLQQVKDAINWVTKTANPKFIPDTWKAPLKNGLNRTGKKDEATFKDSFFMKATSQNNITCLDIHKQPLDVADRSKCYGGMYARAIIDVASYDRSGGKGVACYALAFQKVEDGEPLGSSGVNAVEAFDDLSGTNAPAGAVTNDQLTALL